MSVFLLLLGVVTTAAGLSLVASGLSGHDGAVDTDIITPGTIAAVGGLILIGLGLVVRELQRIERALAVRPVLRPAPSTETTAVASADSPEAPVRIPFPPKPKTSSGARGEPAVAIATPAPPATDIAPQPAAAPPPAAPTPEPPAVAAATPMTEPATSEDGAFERLRAKFPTLARLENGAVIDGAEVPIVTRRVAIPEEQESEVKHTALAAGGGRTNGATPPRGTPPRSEQKPRPPASADKPKASVLNAFWPAGPRRDQQPTAAPAAAPVATAGAEPKAVRPAPAAPSPAAVEPAAAVPVSALKSGVVEGMAYTLYSDGSIEAQLAQGKLRFSSITALRDHIERGA